jgi:hypothetical protein
MTVALLTPPRTQIVHDPSTRRVRYLRECDRCPTVREVRDPHARKNLCKDCLAVLSPAAIERWAA